MPARDEAAGIGADAARRGRGLRPEPVHRRRLTPPPPDCVSTAAAAGLRIATTGGIGVRRLLLRLAGGLGLGLGTRLRCRCLGLDPFPRLASSALLFLADQLAQLSLGVGLGLLQLLGLSLCRLLGVGNLIGLVSRRLTLLLERLLLLGQLADRLFEIVGVRRAGVQGDAGQLVALELLAELRRLAEDPHPGRAGVDERLDRDIAELRLKLGNLSLLLPDGLLGGGNVVFELGQLVEGDVVLLGELGGLLLQRFDHVGVLLDLAALVVDRIGRDDAGTRRWKRRGWRLRQAGSQRDRGGAIA